MSYRRRLENDLKRWQDTGWVSAEGAEAIRFELAAGSRGGLTLAPILAVLGAVLFGFAAMSFVAANWQAMSKLARLVLLFSALWLAYGTAAFLFKRNMAAFAHAAILVGIGVYGASIMLIAQMYHMDGNPPDAVLFWGLGALLAGVLLRSTPALFAALALFCLWSSWESAQSDQVHLPFLATWLVTASAFAWLRWRPAIHLCALALSLWLILLGYLLTIGEAHAIVVAIGLVAAVVGMAARGRGSYADIFAQPLLCYGLTVAFAGSLALQLIGSDHVPRLLALAAATLLILVGVLAYGNRSENKPVMWLAYIGFCIELVTLYFKTFGTLLNTSLFFLSAGALVTALAALAWHLHKRQFAGDWKASS
jgi:uncharacterized membrane protein